MSSGFGFCNVLMSEYGFCRLIQVSATHLLSATCVVIVSSWIWKMWQFGRSQYFLYLTYGAATNRHGIHLDFHSFQCAEKCVRACAAHTYVVRTINILKLRYLQVRLSFST